MSIPKLGLNEQQLSYLAFFKEGRGTVYKPKADVFLRQNQYLVECETLIKRLKQNWELLEKESKHFLTNFPSFEEDRLRRIAINGDNWCATKHSLNQTARNAARTYLPPSIAETQRTFEVLLSALETYLISAKHYLNLCSIEKEIVAAYKAKVRNYHEIEVIYDRYKKLPTEIRGFIREEPLRILNELMDKVQLLHDFNRSMEELGNRYEQFTPQVKNGTMTFSYGAWDTVKKALSDVPSWIAAYGRLADWVNKLNDENQILLIGVNNATRTNSHNEYQTYAVAIPKMQKLLDESKLFYQACDVCLSIEKLSRNLNRKKSEVSRVQRDCDALPVDAAKYVDAKMRALLASMMDSSDRLSQLEACVSALEQDFSRFPGDIKNGSPKYVYERFDALQGTMSKVSLWKESYRSIQLEIKELNGKVTIPSSLTQRINSLTGLWQKLTNVSNAYEKMEKAYRFETRLIDSSAAFKKREELAMSLERELENLPHGVADLVSVKWKNALAQAVTMHKDCIGLRNRVVVLESKYIELDKRAPNPSYENYSESCRVADKYNELKDMLKTLTDDVAAYNKKYGFDGVSLDNLRQYDAHMEGYFYQVEQLKKCYGLFQWALHYDANFGNYAYSDLRTKEAGEAYREMIEKLTLFEGDRKSYLEFDSQNVMENIFARISANVAAIKDGEDRRLAAHARKRCAKLIASIASSVLTLCAGIVIAYFMSQTHGEGIYWLLLVAFCGVGVGNIFLVKWRFESAFLWIATIAIYATYAFIYSVPMHFYSLGSSIWYMSYIVMAVIVSIIVSAIARVDRVSVVLSGVYGVGGVLFTVGIIVARVVVKFQNSFFFDGGFFGTIGNIFIGVWNLIVGLIVGIVKVLGMVIGAGFWMPSLFGDAVTSGVLNVVLYAFVLGFVGAAIVASTRDAY